MKKLSIVILLGMVCLATVPGMAQKILPYTFKFEHQADSLKELDVQVLTQVSYANAVSLRLYFKGTQLGENSYLLLEGMDGSKQELRKQDLENWRYSSAYFNGNAVKVSLIEAAGEKNMVHISEMKVSEVQAKNSTARIVSPSLQSATQITSAASASITETYPHAKAVGRFTDGTYSYGTGWIAPNGAIVTSWDTYVFRILGVSGKSFDIIEFNVPLSDGTTVKHPSPQDQYPLKISASPNASDFSNIIFKDQNGIHTAGWGVVEALPNSTGLRPGERQQAYFRIATNPSSSILDAMGNVPVDIFHYGQLTGDNNTGQFRTLRVLQTSLLKQNTYLSIFTDGSRDNFVIYNAANLLGLGEEGFQGKSDGGAPVTYQGYNIAIGIHELSLRNVPSFGLGFRHDGLRNSLKTFFSSNAVYVDSDGLYDPANGDIHKPYLTVWSAAQNAPSGAQVYIAKGTYYAPLTINRPMTLRAPVGKVVLGAPNPYARVGNGPSIPRELLIDNNLSINDFAQEELELSATLVSSPNPFSDRTELKYSLPEETLVTVKVYDILGNEIHTLLQTSQMKGNHSIIWDGREKGGKLALTGMYIIKLQAGAQIQSIRVIKK